MGKLIAFWGKYIEGLHEIRVNLIIKSPVPSRIVVQLLMKCTPTLLGKKKSKNVWVEQGWLEPTFHVFSSMGWKTDVH